MSELTEVADGVWVRHSSWVWTNSMVVRTDDGLVLVDPGVTEAELAQLADDVDRLGIPVIAGFATHPHFDHLLWHPRFGDVPRYATSDGAQLAAETFDEQREGASEEGVTGAPLDLIGLVEPLPAQGGPIPGRLIEHRAHAVGHAAVLLADRGVLLAGDLLSDELLPIFDPRQTGQVAAFETALQQIEAVIADVDVLVPGHGGVARGPEVAARLAADQAYVEAVKRDAEPDDARMKAAEWLSGIHEGNVAQTRGTTP